MSNFFVFMRQNYFYNTLVFYNLFTFQLWSLLRNFMLGVQTKPMLT